MRRVMMLAVCFSLGMLFHSRVAAQRDTITAEKVHAFYKVYHELFAQGSAYADYPELRADLANYVLRMIGTSLENLSPEEFGKVDFKDTNAPVLLQHLAPYLQHPSTARTYSSQLTNVFYTIDSVISITGKEVRVLLQYGARNGIVDEASGWAWTVYESEKRPSNTYLGVATVVSVSPYTSVVSITPATGAEYTVAEGDHVELRIPMQRRDTLSLLQDLALYNITFLNRYGEPLTSAAVFKLIDLQEATPPLLEIMRDDIIATGEMFAHDSAFQAIKVTSGKFAGMNLIELLKATTLVDVRAFLGFVKDYPGKYMGHSWKINETYATWALNGTPIESGSQAWLIDTLMSHYPGDDFASFVQQNKALMMDSLPGEWNAMIQQMFANGQTQKALLHSQAMYAMGEAAGWGSVQLEGLNNVGYAYQMDSAYFKAIDFFTRAIRLDSGYINAYWNRSFAYAAMDQYADAIRDLKMVAEGAPWFSAAPGNIGWYYMKQGEIEKSAPWIKRAYQLDSTQMSWNINYGHLLLLTGEKEEAYRYYQRTLDLLTSEEDYLLGPVGDFDFFIKKGWYLSEVKAAKAWMEDQYQRIYRFRVQADAALDSATAYREKEQWTKALKWYQKAKQLEAAGEQPRDWEQYLYHGWIGRSYQELEQYSKAEEAYKMALQVSRQRLSQDEVINSLELLGWLHEKAGNTLMSEAYYADARAVERWQRDTRGSNHLFVLSIGINNYGEGAYRYAESDATAVATAVSEHSRLLFDGITVTTLTGPTATHEAIRKAFLQVIEQSKPGDTFMLYFAGKTTADSMQYMVPAANTAAIPMDLLHKWLMLMPASKQMVVFDASDPAFANALINRLANDDKGAGDGHYKMVISPFSSRRESTEATHAQLTGYLLSGLAGGANNLSPLDSAITVFELQSYIAAGMNYQQVYEPLISYVQGMDFGLAFATPVTATIRDEVPPEIEIRSPRLTRGGLTETSDATTRLEVKIFDGSPLASVTLNGQPVELNEGNVLETFLQLSIGNNTFIINAADEAGNRASDTVQVKRIPATTQTAQSTFSFAIKKGRDIALFIASDTYQEWNDLNNPVRDARAIQKVLATQYGFEIDTLFNPTHAAFKQKIYQYLEGGFRPEDRLFVFIAGHGVYDKVMQDGYLATVDSRKHATYKEDSYIPLSWLSMKLDRCAFNKIFVMIDACFGGAFGDIQYARSGEKTRLYLTSGNKEYVDDGPAGGHSPFAHGILEILQSKGPKVGELSAMAFPVYLSQTADLSSEPRYGAFASSAEDPEFTFTYDQPVTDIKTASLDTGF